MAGSVDKLRCRRKESPLLLALWFPAVFLRCNTWTRQTLSDSQMLQFGVGSRVRVFFI